jgi:hypothetical protein
MFLGTLSFGLFGLFVLLGTSAPIITRIWGPASNVQPEFYNRMGLPFAILIGTLVSFAPFLIWRASSMGKALRRMVWPLTITLVSVVILALAGIRHPGLLMLLGVGILAFLANLWVLTTIMRKNLASAGGYIAHVGIGLAILGIVASTSYSQKETVVLPQDEEVLALGYGFKYMGIREVEAGRKNAYDVALRTTNRAFIMSPTMYFSDFNAGMMKKPAIQMFWQRDVYISPIGHATDPLEDRVVSKIVLTRGQPMEGFGMELEFLGFENRAGGDGDGHNHPVDEVVAMIQMTRGSGVETVEAVLRTLPDGHTEVFPAPLGTSGYSITLLALDTSGDHAQVGVERPPTGLFRGETGWIDGNAVTFTDFEVEMASRQGGSVKVFAHVEVEFGGETYHVRPGIISRPGTEELELVEAPIGRTGYNLVLARIDAAQAQAFFHLVPTPREYFYAEVSLKPFIGLLWIGTVITVFGLITATLHRGRLAMRHAAAVAREQELGVKKNGKREAA